MFIYKITIANLVYIGFDTHEPYKMNRFKCHVKNSSKNEIKSKLYLIMSMTHPASWHYEILEDGFKSISSLARAEIKYIEQFNSFEKGLNSTRGGDGIGRHNIADMTDEDILKIKQSLRDNAIQWNKTRWKNTSADERKKMTTHLHTEEINFKKSSSLKDFYHTHSDIKREKYLPIKKWQNENYAKLKENNAKNGMIGAEKVSIMLKSIDENGIEEHYRSKNDFMIKKHIVANTVLKHTKNGNYYKGLKLWVVTKDFSTE